MTNFTHGLDPRTTNKEAETRIVKRASVEKRRLLRNLGIKYQDLDTVGRARFDGFFRAHAVVDLARSWMDENPEKLINKDGRPAPIMDLYLRALSVRRYELDKLEEFIRVELKTPEDEMRELLARSDR